MVSQLAGVPAYERPRPDQVEPFFSERIEPAVSAELAARVRGVVLAHQVVAKSLEGKRFEWIGISVVDAKAAADSGWGKDQSLLAVLYSYGDNRAIHARLDASGRQVEAVDHLAYQPPPTNAEIERAIEMARADERHRDQIGDDLVGSAILVSPTDSQSATFNHRQFDVRFAGPCDRLPRHAALVDLSTETVVSVGGCCDGDLFEEPGGRS
jgi:hypothetical protein